MLSILRPCAAVSLPQLPLNFLWSFLLRSQAEPSPPEVVPAAEARWEQAVELLDAYGNSILRLAYSYLHDPADAEDILQDTLIQFLRQGPAFESGGQAKSWLLQVAANLSKNRIRYRRLRDTDPLPESLAAEQREDLSFVWEAVRSLPQPYREVIHLFYYEGYPTAEIAAILDVNEATVRTHLRRGRVRLRKLLKEAYDFEEI